MPSNYTRLNENLALNGLVNVQTFNIALSDKPGELDIVLREDFKTGGETGNASVAIGSEADDGFERLTISSRALDSFVEVFEDINIGVIKIDIEGHQDICFTGAKKLLTTWRPYILLRSKRLVFR